MEKHFEDLVKIREHLISYLQRFDLKRLTLIPMGFQNNIFWNCAHAVVTQQLMTYYLSDTKMLVDRDWVDRFKKGTFGDPNIVEDEVDQLIELLEYTAIRLEKDYYAEKLNFFRPYDTSFGIRLETIEDAIRYNNLHESLHLGYVQALARLVV